MEGERRLMPRAGRVVAAAALAVSLALVAAVVSGGEEKGGGGTIGAASTALRRPDVLLATSPGNVEQLVTISPTAFAYPRQQMDVGELASVPPVLGVPVPTAASAASGAWPVSQALYQGVAGQVESEAPRSSHISSVQLAPVLSVDKVAAPPSDDSKLSLSAQLRSQMDASKRAAELTTLHELARRKRHSGEWAKGVEEGLKALQGTEAEDRAKIAAERAHVEDLERRLATQKIAESLKASAKEAQSSSKVEGEERTVAMLKKELAQAATEVKATAPNKVALKQDDKGKHSTEAEAEAEGKAGEVGLAEMAEKNSKAIEELKEKLRRLRLVSEGQYGILYKRLDSIGTQLQQSKGNDARLVLQAHAAVKQGNAMVDRGQELASEPMDGSQASRGGMHGASAGQESASSFSSSFSPERLFGGYNLAGGSHPGEELQQARKQWMEHAIDSEHTDPLAVKRKEIQQSLTRIALGNAAESSPVGTAAEAGQQQQQQQQQQEQERRSRATRGGQQQQQEQEQERQQEQPRFVGSQAARERDGDSGGDNSERGSDEGRFAGRDESIRPLSKRPQQHESRAEAGFQRLAQKSANIGVHPRGMHGSVYRHFMHELKGEEAKQGLEETSKSSMVVGAKSMLFAPTIKSSTKSRGDDNGAELGYKGFMGVGL
jgi:hypothetical protein